MQSLPELSIREQQVAQLLLSGVQQQQIAQQLGIALRTVKLHAQRIYRKSGVESLREFRAAYSFGTVHRIKLEVEVTWQCYARLRSEARRRNTTVEGLAAALIKKALRIDVEDASG